MLNGKIILVTGATGSFGKKFVQIVLVIRNQHCTTAGGLKQTHVVGVILGDIDMAVNRHG